MNTSFHYFISGCEPSGDLLAAELVREMRQIMPEALPVGICGPAMRAEGVIELAAMEDLTVMGFVEVLKHLAGLVMLEKDLLERIQRLNPRFAVLVDYPGFHLHLAEELRRRGFPVIQYVAPQLWAWGEKRTERLRRVTDLVLGIMPFEEEFFRERGVNFQYVGTPQVDRSQTSQKDRSLFKLSEEAPVIGFFPGSRFGEVSRITRKVADIRAVLRKEHPEVEIAVSVAPSVDFAAFSALIPPERWAGISRELAEKGVAVDESQRTRFVRGRSLQLMKTVDAALVTSGTATLECALSLTPMAVGYVASNMTYRIAKRVVRLPYISLVNLVAGEKLVSEYIQHFAPEAAARELWVLATDERQGEAQRRKLERLFARLKGKPGHHAALAIRQFVEQRSVPNSR